VAQTEALREQPVPVVLVVLAVLVELAELAEAAARDGMTYGSSCRTVRRARRSGRAMAACIFVDDVRDKLREQPVDDAQSSRHLPRDVQHEQRIRAQIAPVKRIQIMRRDAQNPRR
jgi:hypothetical protein